MKSTDKIPVDKLRQMIRKQELSGDCRGRINLQHPSLVIEPFVLWDDNLGSDIEAWSKLDEKDIRPYPICPLFRAEMHKLAQCPTHFHLDWCMSCKVKMTRKNQVSKDRFVEVAMKHRFQFPNSTVNFVMEADRLERDQKTSDDVCEKCDAEWWASEDEIDIEYFQDRVRANLVAHYHKTMGCPVFWTVRDDRLYSENKYASVAHGGVKSRFYGDILKECFETTRITTLTPDVVMLYARTMLFKKHRLSNELHDMMTNGSSNYHKRLRGELTLVAVLDSEQVFHLFYPNEPYVEKKTATTVTTTNKTASVPMVLSVAPMTYASVVACAMTRP